MLASRSEAAINCAVLSLSSHDEDWIARALSSNMAPLRPVNSGAGKSGAIGVAYRSAVLARSAVGHSMKVQPVLAAEEIAADVRADEAGVQAEDVEVRVTRAQRDHKGGAMLEYFA